MPKRSGGNHEVETRNVGNAGIFLNHNARTFRCSTIFSHVRSVPTESSRLRLHTHRLRRLRNLRPGRRVDLDAVAQPLHLRCVPRSRRASGFRRPASAFAELFTQAMKRSISAAKSASVWKNAGSRKIDSMPLTTRSALAGCCSRRRSGRRPAPRRAPPGHSPCGRRWTGWRRAGWRRTPSDRWSAGPGRR